MSTLHGLVAREEEKCVEVTPDENGHVPNYACNSYYPMDPNTGVAAAVTIIFLLLSLIHVFLAFRHKAKYTAILITGGLWEFASFALRVYGSKNQQKKNVSIISFLLFTLAPIWINAFVYMVAARLVSMFSPTKRVFGFSSIAMSKLFILFDILAFIVQLAGGLMISPGASAKRIEIGLRVYQAGLGLQQAFILTFIVLLAGFHKQMIDLEKGGWVDSHHRKWKLMLYIEYATLALITTRVAFRLAEYILPHEDNPLVENEVYLYTLDALPMALCLLIYIVYHPGRVIQGPGSDYRSIKAQVRAEKKANKQAKKMGMKNADDDDDEEDQMIGNVPGQNQWPANTGYEGAAAYGAPAPGFPQAGAPGLYDPHQENRGYNAA